MATHKKRRNKNKTKKKSHIKPIKIDSDFESGNIKLKSINKDNNKYRVNLEINKEPYNRQTPKEQKRYENWFYFKAENVKDKDITFRIDNIKVIKNFWKGFNVAMSYDNKTWTRLPTKVNPEKRTLEWRRDLPSTPKKEGKTLGVKGVSPSTPSTPSVWFAYYPPYPFSKSRKVLPNMEIIGKTKDGNPILMKKLGHGPTKVWLISGQHPGETINSWILEGFLKEIKNKTRTKRQKQNLFSKYTFYIIPNANPDGNQRGNWYVTSDGINMNRDWIKVKSPEVRAIKKQLDKHGYDLVFDIHGDEETKYHFLSTSSSSNQNKLHKKINHKLNKKMNKTKKHFQKKDHYKRKTYNTKRNSLDDYTNGITIEGAMKHKLFNYDTLQKEPLHIGRSLAQTLIELGDTP